MVAVTPLQMVLSVISGLLVGFSLGLIGGGGSILAIPLLIYFVGFNHPHLAIGTTALAVGITAYINVIPHFMDKHVYLKEGAVFSLPGIVGALIGSELGLLTPGNKLLFIFAILMLVIAAYMLRRKCVNAAAEPNIKGSVLKVAGMGFLVGLLSGYFGIGGGFLIVPGLILSGGLNIIEAVGTSLIAVGTFGVTTAARYALSGEVNVVVAVLYVVGGIVGGWGGAKLAGRMPKRTLTQIFAVIIIVVGIYMLYVNASAFR
ncbi:MAG: sulfite exporter TauE/SafE family protein [Thermoprotei archaeon]